MEEIFLYKTTKAIKKRGGSSLLCKFYSQKTFHAFMSLLHGRYEKQPSGGRWEAGALDAFKPQTF